LPPVSEIGGRPNIAVDRSRSMETCSFGRSGPPDRSHPPQPTRSNIGPSFLSYRIRTSSHRTEFLWYPILDCFVYSFLSPCPQKSTLI
jgi:hypothetical protein